MPEMPEVEIIRRYLDKQLAGQRIEAFESLLPRQIQFPAPDKFEAMVCGQEIAGMGRRGKYMLMRLVSGTELVFHLRMTGSLVYVPAGETFDNNHIRQIFYLLGGGRLYFADIRTFGTICAVQPGEEGLVRGLAEMGPEPLSPEFTPTYLQQEAHGRRTPVKNFLLDQRRVGGIGNIYADEALFLAKVHPSREAGSLTVEEWQHLHAAVNQVIAAGIEDGGTTFRDYRNGAGGKGSHQDNLYVYNRQGEPCRECGVLIEYTKLGGRGTHYCPMCQQLERGD